jgi:DNA-binding XRE family transcriptional regulator
MAQRTKIKHKKPYNVWLARKQLGLTQTQLAYLLGNTYKDKVHRLEKGLQLPSLETALLLEIIFQIPTKVLFSHFYQQLQEKVKTRIKNSPETYQHLLKSHGQLLGEVCTFADILETSRPSQAQMEKLYKHIMYLVNRSRK